MARKQGTTSAVINAEIAAQPNVTVDVFSPGAEWVTIKNAAAMLGFDGERGPARIRGAIKTAPAFTAPGAVQSITIEGTDLPAIVYLHRNAVAAYGASLAETGGPRRGRHGSTKRAIIDVKPSDREAVAAALAPFGITLREPSKARRKAKPSADAASDGDTPIGSDGNLAESNGDASNGESAEIV